MTHTQTTGARQGVQEALERERLRVRRSLDTLAAARRLLSESQAAEGAVNGQPADVASDLAEEELEMTLEMIERERLGEVEAALGRLAEGCLGLCERCGDAIAPERMRILPWARQCVACASLDNPMRRSGLPRGLVRR